MDLFAVLAARRSVRAFESRDLSADLLDRILQAANSAPSAGDLQAYEIVVVRDPDRRSLLAKAAYDQEFIAAAPVVLVFLANPRRNRDRYRQRAVDLYAPQDATIAATHAQLAATALGLGSCWVGAFDDASVAALVSAPPDLQPVAMLPLGYPAETPDPRPRRPLVALTHAERVKV